MLIHPLRLLVIIFIALSTTKLSAQVLINEFTAANMSLISDNDGDFEDVVELYNTTAAAFDLTGWYLSDRTDEPTKWQFPAGTTIAANGFLRIWASGKNVSVGANIHTNFKITQTKNSEAIVLSDPAGLPIDVNEIDMPCKRNNSWGRVSNGASEWGILTTPTIGANNVNVKKPYALKPEISPAGGGYTAPVTVTLTTPEPNSTIRYTLDGSAPNGTSPAYTAPFNVTGTTVVRAVTFSNDPQVPSSFIESNTYFINVSHTVKILSIYSTGVADLLDGTYDIEPEGGFEMYSPTFERLDESYGEFDKHGNDSWAYDQRGFDYVVRDEYGYDYAVKDPIFPNTDRDEYQHLIVKAAANDNYPFEDGAHIRDAYVHVLSQNAHLELDERSYEPCVVYLNGQYWGLYELREKVDDSDFTEHYYNKDGDEIDFIKTWGGTWTEYGDMAQWNPLYDYIVNNNMALPVNYDYVQSKFNLLSLIDYMIINTHSVCTDWLNYNTGWWHSNDDQVKWRYILWDLDATFGHYINYTGVPDDSPTAQPCDNQDPAISDPEGHTEMLTSLLENPNFRETYLNRYADLNNTYFSCDYMIALLDSMITRIEPEMPRQVARWGGTVGAWQGHVQELRDFILARCTAIDEGIVDCYDVDPFNVVIKVEPPLSGNVNMNNIVNINNTWTGLYYSNITLDMAATPANATYFFDHWEVVNGAAPTDIYNPDATFTITAPDTIIAHFNTPAQWVVLVEPPTAGTVQVNGITVDLPYTSSNPTGISFILDAFANSGYVFSNWSSQTNTLLPDVNQSNVYFTLAGNDTIIAHFDAPQLNLSVEIMPNNGGTVSINGNTPSTFPYTASYDYNTLINAIATPEIGFQFSHWELNNHALADPNNPNATFNITQTDVLQAIFTPIELQLTLTADPANSGAITFNGNNISTFPYTTTLNYNDLISLNATPNANYGFVNWTADNTSLSAPNTAAQSFNITQTDTLTAHFAENIVSITISVEGMEGGTITLNGETISTTPYTINVAQGTTINLNATANSGYSFGTWQANGVTGINPNSPNISFDANGNITIQVSFNAIIPSENCGPATPTAFSPNNDGNNDLFGLHTHCPMQNYTLSVFDRWGKLLFTTTDPTDAWNGKSQGRECELGVYVWTATYDIQNNGTWETRTEKGNITLVR
jgi:gliding motility-associated-like protein